MGRDNREVREFVSCALEAIDNPVMLLISGSAAHEEMTKLSDIDGNAFVASTQSDELSTLEKSFETIARERYGKTTRGGFYEPHWSLFVYPEEAIKDKETFSNHLNGLPVDFTMFNLKENTILVHGEDRRPEIPAQYSQDMIDEWASFAPSYHLHRAEELSVRGKYTKACYALSRSILQVSRVVIWKEAECVSSSYEKIVNSVKNYLESPLPEWALRKRKADFKSRPKELEERLEPAGKLLRTIIGKYVRKI
ncbi:hypothetical protein AKJ52_00175 [candidate division MSBL1 archaeon SCGC-AAA382C18]|uniref:Polymerase nucleotidyl transferase domain-containing protein n=1 Tax=candidate division MSBL1 archaeon SCGC-AAA382C18 TaxID=1698281 RepID=A0A133VM38_9EURY|nr:hypothetical protein AKJ52_00175 [candidate division MSBL1 archaeon SCGC-AAA382C18]